MICSLRVIFLCKLYGHLLKNVLKCHAVVSDLYIYFLLQCKFMFLNKKRTGKCHCLYVMGVQQVWRIKTVFSCPIRGPARHFCYKPLIAGAAFTVPVTCLRNSNVSSIFLASLNPRGQLLLAKYA